MTRFGSTLMTEQSGPQALVSHAGDAERAGRFTLGLGSGENLNEHVVGQGWPAVAVGQEMLEEAVTIIRRLLDGEHLTVEGDYFRVDQARLWDRPAHPVEIGVAVGGEEAVQRFAPLADHLIATEPSAELVSGWRSARDAAGLGASRAIGQVPICCGPDQDAAVDRAHELFRWFGGGWHVNSDLPVPAGVEGASQLVRPEDVGSAIACGPDLDELTESLRPFWEAGFTDVALVQVGDESQEEF